MCFIFLVSVCFIFQVFSVCLPSFFLFTRPMLLFVPASSFKSRCRCFFCGNAPTSSKLPLTHKDQDKDKKDSVTRLSKVLFSVSNSFRKIFYLLFFFTCDKTCFTVCLDIEKLWPQYILITGSVICSRKYQNNNLVKKELQKHSNGMNKHNNIKIE